MTKVLGALLLAIALLVGLPTVAGTPGHHTFDDDAVLDASQVVDMRGVWGELICHVGDEVPRGCEIDEHQAVR